MNVAVDQAREDEPVAKVDHLRAGGRFNEAVVDGDHFAAPHDEGGIAPRRATGTVEQRPGVNHGIAVRLWLGQSGRLGKHACGNKGSKEGRDTHQLTPREQ